MARLELLNKQNVSVCVRVSIADLQVSCFVLGQVYLPNQYLFIMLSLSTSISP